MAENKQAWGSRIGLILAMAGNAVGLGNFLRFPIQAVQNGGGAFIIPYLISFVLLGLPLLFIEWSTGKFGGIAGHHSPPMIMQELDKRPIWKYLGSMGIFCSIFICAYYVYIESWTLSYALHSLFGTFYGMNETEVADFFGNYLNLSVSTSFIPYDTFVCFLACLLFNIWILSKGIKNGIERVAKIAMPMLLVFGIFLVFRAYTLDKGDSGASFDSMDGFNYLWTPQFDSLANPKVWLAAGGQVFFTMSLGMGCVQCYASYIKKHDDIVLNSLTAGFTNEFTEIVLGSAIIFPIAVGYFGVPAVLEMTHSGGFSLGFKTLPYLFGQWGPVLSSLAGLAFFGLLFFSAVTSSLAISTPMVAFFSDSYKWSQKKSSWIYGIVLFFLALPPVLFFDKGVFDEYDFWASTIALFFFAMIEAIVFSWVMGVNKGWRLIHYGCEVRLPVFFKYVLKYVTPVMMTIIFVTATIKPKDDDWSQLSLSGWELDNSSLIGVLTHKGIGANSSWVSDYYYSDYVGEVTAVAPESITITNEGNVISVSLPADTKPVVGIGDKVEQGTALSKGTVINNVLYIDLTRIMLLVVLGVLCVMIYFVEKKKKKISIEED
ncbi:MAG: sodium-dependent transporter [Paludibacteraceae bacterium]|nr:sodium-dependent transporter [Paludibacteraceae bacterium]